MLSFLWSNKIGNVTSLIFRLPKLCLTSYRIYNKLVFNKFSSSKFSMRLEGVLKKNKRCHYLLIVSARFLKYQRV